ncbi:hypothetical protein Tsubulata_042794, partial [Turnera subulata]
MSLRLIQRMSSLQGSAGLAESSDWLGISSLTFTTNRETYGPFGNDGLDHETFEFRCGNGEGFGGFHGTADSHRV